MGKSEYQGELDAIRALRDAFPNEGPKKLANRIKEGETAFADAGHKAHARRTNLRGLLSIYSVIRRHDASKKAAKKAAKKVPASV